MASTRCCVAATPSTWFATQVGCSFAKAEQGLITGHAYSILDCAKLASGAKLLKIRNPHAQGEWQGKYSDKDAAWMAEGVTSMKGKRVDRESDDGIFWMCVEDFVANVDDVYFVGASRSVGTETMEFHEGLGLLGPCRGCVGGSLGYCFGGGCRLTCFPERRGTLTMLRDAGLNFDAKGWHVKRYHDEEAVGGKHNKAGWMDNIGGGASKEELEQREADRRRERGEGAPPCPEICDEQPRGDEAV